MENENTSKAESNIEQNSRAGYISLYRSIWNHWLNTDEKRQYSKLEAWLYLLSHASYRDKKFMFNNQLIEEKRGQFITTELALSKQFNWSRTKVRNFLELLNIDQMIIHKKDNKKTIITILNYDSYQDWKTSKEHQKNIKRTSKEHQKDTPNNINNINNINKEREENAVGSLSPFSFDQLKDIYEDLNLNNDLFANYQSVFEEIDSILNRESDLVAEKGKINEKEITTLWHDYTVTINKYEMLMEKVNAIAKRDPKLIKQKSIYHAVTQYMGTDLKKNNSHAETEVQHRDWRTLDDSNKHRGFRSGEGADHSRNEL